MEANGKSEPFVLVIGEGTTTKGKKYQKGTDIRDIHFSPDGSRVIYTVETNPNDRAKSKLYTVIDEHEEGPWSNIGSIQWSTNGSYTYLARDTEGMLVVVQNGKTILTDSRSDGYKIEVLDGPVVNPVSGALYYSLKKFDGARDFARTTKIVYDGKESREYNGLAGGMSFNRSIFSPDGKHYIYFIDEEKKMVIDGKEIPIEGDLLGSWGGSDGGFSKDGKWFGTYVLKDKAVWWIPYNLENITS